VSKGRTVGMTLSGLTVARHFSLAGVGLALPSHSVAEVERTGRGQLSEVPLRSRWSLAPDRKSNLLPFDLRQDSSGRDVLDSQVVTNVPMRPESTDPDASHRSHLSQLAVVGDQGGATFDGCRSNDRIGQLDSVLLAQVDNSSDKRRLGSVKANHVDPL